MGKRSDGKGEKMTFLQVGMIEQGSFPHLYNEQQKPIIQRKMDNIVELKMTDGSIWQFETYYFDFDNATYCLLTPVEKDKHPETFIMKAIKKDDSILLKKIEDAEECQRATDYVQVLKKLACPANMTETELYELLTSSKLPENEYDTTDLGEGMAAVIEKMYGWWKLRFLINHNTRQAWEFMDKNQRLCTITHEDIDWESVNELPSNAIGRVERLSAHFPTFIKRFRNGVAEVGWQLTPDGRYYMDEDGYGMTDDEEITIYGKIDQQGKVVKKFK